MITDKLDWPAGFKADIAKQLADSPSSRRSPIASQEEREHQSRRNSQRSSKRGSGRVYGPEETAWRDAIRKVIAFLESETKRFRQCKLNIAEGISTLVTNGQPTDPVCLERWIRNNDREIEQCYTVLGLINRGWSIEQIRNTASQSDIGWSLAEGESAAEFLKYMT